VCAHPDRVAFGRTIEKVDFTRCDGEFLPLGGGHEYPAKRIFDAPRVENSPTATDYPRTMPLGRAGPGGSEYVIDKDDNTEQPVLRTIIADDDPLVRRLIRDTLQRADVTVIAEASTGREAVELALFYRPDVVVMDFMMPEMDGIEATRRIFEHDPSIRVVMLTGAGDEELGLRGLRAGAAGYLSKEVELDALPRALRGALEGEAAISRQLAMKLIERYRAAPTGGAGLRPVRSRLTDREWEVLDLLSTGATTDQIAKTLVLSSETVRSHLKNLYRKLEVNSRDEAVKAASRLRSLSGLPA
jgi:NarL family two-component system response regulator LiaR